MIISFKDKKTKQLFDDNFVKEFQSFSIQARIKLEMLDAAKNVFDLANPPGNKLEKLKGDRVGQWSIRINNKWRICFNCKDTNAYNVEIIDYH